MPRNWSGPGSRSTARRGGGGTPKKAGEPKSKSDAAASKAAPSRDPVGCTAASQGGPEREAQRERRPVTMVTNVYESVVRTMAILAPELILLLAAMGMMTLSAFVQQPRRQWCRAAVWSILAALLALFWASGKETDLYAVGGPQRRALLLDPIGRPALGPGDPGPGARPAARRAVRRVLRVAPDDVRGHHAGRRGQRHRVPVRRPGAGEHPHVLAPLPLPAHAHDPGGGDQVFLPEHLRLRALALRPGLPLRRHGAEQPQGDGVPELARRSTCPT